MGKSVREFRGKNSYDDYGYEGKSSKSAYYERKRKSQNAEMKRNKRYYSEDDSYDDYDKVRYYGK